MPKLNNWLLKPGSGSNPEFRLKGVVSGHKKYTDGSYITTSHIIGLRGEHIVTQSGAEYELGEPVEKSLDVASALALFRKLGLPDLDQKILLHLVP